MKSRDENPDPSAITIRLLGPLEVKRQGTNVGYSAKKGLALLACLCLRSDSYAPRETLTGLLWSDSGEEQARASLRQTMSGLRKGLGVSSDKLILSDGAGLSLDPAGFATDLGRFNALMQKHDLTSLKDAAALCRGDLLEGFPPITPEFDRWLDAERSAVWAQVMAVLLRLCDASEAAGDSELTIATAHRLIALDPLQEHVHRRLIRIYMQQKRHDAALRQFETLKVLLMDELGVLPEPETQDLVKEVRRQRSSQAMPTSAPAKAPVSRSEVDRLSGRPSVAVLPFKSLTLTDDAAMFGEAVSEEIIVELARENALLVVSRGSSFQFSLAETDASEIGHRLGVRFLLGGSARISGDKVRVTAHLIQCETGREIWAERHDRPLRDIFDIQTDIARTVTATVVGRIAEVDAEATLHRPFESLESYSLAAQGYRHFLSYSPQGYSAAISCFDRAVVLDPGFARAWGLLALLNIYRRWYFDMRTDVEDLVPLAEKAIQLEPRDAKGHCALGLAHLLLRNFDKAGFHYDAGLRANPNDDLLLIEHGRYLMYVDRPEDGLRQVAEAMRINPYHANWYWNVQGRCLHMMGRTQEALEAFQRVHAPNFWVHAYIAACHSALGNAQGAAEARNELLQKRPDFDVAAFMRVFPYRNQETAHNFLDVMGLAK